MAAAVARGGRRSPPATAGAKPAKERPRGRAPAAARKAPRRPVRRRRKERAPSPRAASDATVIRARTATTPAPARRAPPPARAAAKVKTKTYSFGAMDVEGKLKTPQLLYFLNRVKLELDMSAPDKRSFMKELQQSADDKNL